MAAAPFLPGNSLSSLHRPWTLWGWALSFAGAALSFYVIVTAREMSGNLIWPVAVVLVLAGETLQRMGFVSLGLYDGMKK